MGKVGLSEGDRGVTVGTSTSSEVRATQVGVGEVSLSEGDGGVAIGAIGSKL